MAVTTEEFKNGTGSATEFTFAFPYLQEADVKVATYANHTWTETTAFTFKNATTIKFNSAPASGTGNIRIYRDTFVDTAKGIYSPGSTIRAQDLNDNQDQILYALQEKQSNLLVNPQLGSNSVKTAQIVEKNVTTATIADGAVTTIKLGDDSVTNAKIASNQIDSEHYVDGSIDHVHLSNDCVDGDNIADNSITSSHLTAGSVGTSNIGNNQVENGNIADGAVTGAKIANNTIFSAQIGTNAIGSDELGNDAVLAANIADDQVQNEHIAVDAVQASQIAANAVVSGKIDNGAVLTAKIGDNNVTYAKIQNVSATNRVLGRDSSGAGDIEEITPAALRTMINVEDGAQANVVSGLNDLSDVTTSGVANGKILKYVAANSRWEVADDATGAGGVPLSDGDKGDITVSNSGATFTIDNDTVGLDELSASGTASNTTFLRGDNTWASAGSSLTIKDEGTDKTTAATSINFVGSNVTATNSGTDVTVTVSGGSGGDITVQDEGSALSTAATTLNFVGAGVTASGTGATKTITISGGGGNTSTDFKYLELKAHNNASGAFSAGAADYELVTKGTTTAVTPAQAAALIISIGGVIQEPNTGTSIGSNDGFCIDGSSIHFGANLTAHPDFIIYLQGAGVASISDNTVTSAKIVDGTIVNGDIADDTISEAKLDIHNAPSGTDKYLKYTSNGMEWATAGSGTITALNNQAANRLTTIGATTTELDGEASLTFQDTTSTGLISGKQITGRGFECPATVSDDWTIAAGNNAMFPGPMTVAAGKTVTVPANRTLTIV